MENLEDSEDSVFMDVKPCPEKWKPDPEQINTISGIATAVEIMNTISTVIPKNVSTPLELQTVLSMKTLFLDGMKNVPNVTSDTS